MKSVNRYPRISLAVALPLAFALLAALCALPCPRAHAEEPKSPPPVRTDAPPVTVQSADSKSADPNPATDPAGAKPDGETVPIDPTQWTPAMQNAIHPQVAPRAPNVVYAQQPVVALPPLPEIVLKALVELDGGTPAALLEVDGKMHRLVTEGSEITTHANGKQPITLIIRKMTATGLAIEIVQLKQTIHLK